VLDSCCCCPASLGDDSRAILIDLAEPVNCAVPSPLQKFKAARLPGVRSDLKPSLDGWMLSHTFGQDFGHRSLRHGHGSVRRSGRLPAAALRGRRAPPLCRSTAQAVVARPGHL